MDGWFIATGKCEILYRVTSYQTDISELQQDVYIYYDRARDIQLRSFLLVSCVMYWSPSIRMEGLNGTQTKLDTNSINIRVYPWVSLGEVQFSVLTLFFVKECCIVHNDLLIKLNYTKIFDNNLREYYFVD